MGLIKDAFHRMGSPRFFYHGSSLWVRGLYVGGGLGLLVGSFWGLVLAPPDKYQGHSFRIMYMHVPSAHLAEMDSEKEKAVSATAGPPSLENH